MPVDDPRQNVHRWWGSMTIDLGTEAEDGKLAAGTKCIFVKTSCDAHYIVHGTYARKVKVLKDKAEAEKAIRAKTYYSIPDLAKDLDFDDSLPIVEILKIDDVETSPLTKELNALTEALFNDNEWLKEHADIGIDSIKIGRDMARLPR